uniref:glutathione transferase n=2 Tax=unclassified Trichoplax TaxID=2636125 RepID=Q3I769_9METZ|nr:glutathione S-transferase [Trichoplax sp. BZ413]ABA55067.1 glutathione S-transferase [Trichoplax sp. BZ46]
MVAIKLTYFNAPGRAEIVRLILAQGGVEYTDERIEGKDWPEAKTYLAGKTSLEQAQADEIFDFLTQDLQEHIIKFMFVEKDEDKKAELKKKFIEETAPKGLGFLEKRLENNGGEYFTGNLSYADLAFYQFGKFTEDLLDLEEMAKNFPKLAALYGRVSELPNVKKYKESQS